MPEKKQSSPVSSETSKPGSSKTKSAAKPVSSAGPKAAKAAATAPDERRLLSEIEKRAFEIYLERKRENRQGDDASDWYEAEKEIKKKYKLGD